MYQTQKTYIRPHMKMADLINENYSILLLLEHFEIDFAVGDKKVAQLCDEYHIDEALFVIICNLYNGFYPDEKAVRTLNSISEIIRFLKNSHRYYKNDKYPEIKEYLRILHERHQTDQILLIERFFNKYFEEVLEHLDYEEEVAFPYFSELLENGNGGALSEFSVNDYREHHTDIETKLTDLKNLLLRHISIDDDLTIRRKFLYSLFELENDLVIHSLVEELILLPLIEHIEHQRKDG
ncbi:MAG: hemerythrin domain-containing protein [Bacteroidales bacterium]|nr:hemerythrin domain-containing protein [Bacteroidales bacterium]